MKRSQQLACAFAAISLTVPLSAQSTLEDYRPLLDRSPFLTQAFKERLAKSESEGINNYTFVGYVNLEGQWRLCLINNKTNLPVWLQIGEDIDGYTAAEFTPKSQSIRFEKNGIEATLTIDKPK
jgi:hypothetical protein